MRGCATRGGFGCLPSPVDRLNVTPMQIAGRSDAPWDHLFVFHFLSAERDDWIGDRLSALLSREADSAGVRAHDVQWSAKAGRCEIAGRFLDPETAGALLEAWNAPEGDAAFMCYTPNHGIATVSGGQMDWFGLICFQCSNAGIGGAEATLHPPVPNRLLPDGAGLEDHLLAHLPERPFALRS